MAGFIFLCALAALASSTAASPLVTIKESRVTRLPFSTHLNLTSGIKVSEFDRARVQHLIRRAKQKPTDKDTTGANVPVTNAVVTYLANVGVGSPPTNYKLRIDTGSSNTWVGATLPYVPTSTSHKTADLVNVTYGSGNFTGREFIDKVTISPDLIISNQSIGVATSSQGFEGAADGILGLGPADLTLGMSPISQETLHVNFDINFAGTLSPDTKAQIPTVTDNLFAQGTISSNSFAVSFEPTTGPETTNGELTFGGTNPDKFTGNIHFAPITASSSSNHFWGIDQSITYGYESLPILNLTAGIVDTGATGLLLPSDAFGAYKAATGAVHDETTGFLTITDDQLAKLQSLFFHVNGVDYEFTANAQLWPRSLNTAIGGVEGNIYLVAGDLGPLSEQGFNFINGFAFLERFYSVYDKTNSRIGFATTPFTYATTN